jgi:hypothetical protein
MAPAITTSRGNQEEEVIARLSSGHGLNILYAVAVNCIWGLAFVIPEYLRDVDPAVVALGRYFVYGVLSAAILLTVPRAVTFAKRLDLKLVSRLELASGAVAMRYEPRR